MSGLNFSLGGKLDPSFQASLNRATAEAQAAGMRIQNSLRTQIGGLDKQLLKMDPMQPGAAILADKRAALQRALLISQNAQYLSAAKRRIAAGVEEAAVAAKVGEAAATTVTHVAGLNLIMRETLVVFREIGRGNWSRVPGSLSMIAQGFSQLKKISLLTIGAWAFAIGGIVGSFFIYAHRVKKLAEDLATSIVSAFKPEHIAGYLGRLEVMNELQKDVADSARKIQEAHDAVGDSIKRELDLTRDRIAYERELLEAQKANALAAARNPAEREAIEKRFSKLILAKKKEERDAEVAAMKKEANDLPAELMATRYQIASMVNNKGFISEAQDAEILRKRRADADAADAYFKQGEAGEKDTRAHSADADRKIINDLMNKKANSAMAGPYAFGPADQARLDAANARLANNSAAQQSLNAWVNAKGERDRSRERLKELETRVKDDAARLAKLNGTPGHGGLIADQERVNLQKDQEELKLENERLKRVDPGRPLGGREVTERERVGFGSPAIALLDVNKSMDKKLSVIVHNTNPKKTVGPGSFGGDPMNW